MLFVPNYCPFAQFPPSEMAGVLASQTFSACGLCFDAFQSIGPSAPPHFYPPSTFFPLPPSPVLGPWPAVGRKP